MIKAVRLQFLSEAIVEFKYFKDGWRNYVSYAKVPYDAQQANQILNHVTSFIGRLFLAIWRKRLNCSRKRALKFFLDLGGA